MNTLWDLTIFQIANAIVYLVAVCALVVNQFLRLKKVKQPIFSHALLTAWSLGYVLYANYLLFVPRFSEIQAHFFESNLYLLVLFMGMFVITIASFLNLKNEVKSAAIFQLVLTISLAVIVLLSQYWLNLPIKSLVDLLLFYATSVLLAKNMYIWAAIFFQKNSAQENRSISRSIHLALTALGMFVAIVFIYFFKVYLVELMLRTVGEMRIDFIFSGLVLCSLTFNGYLFVAKRSIDPPYVSFFLQATILIANLIVLISVENYSGVVVSIILLKLFAYLIHGFIIQWMRAGDVKVILKPLAFYTLVLTCVLFLNYI